MKLKSFRLRNYRSVLDSKDVDVSPDVTVFAGKNESGKTALLQGVCDIVNARAPLPIDVVTVRATDVPSVDLCWEISDSELAALCKSSSVLLTEEARTRILSDGLRMRVTSTSVTSAGEPAGFSDAPDAPKALTRTLLERIQKLAGDSDVVALGIAAPEYSKNLEEAFGQAQTFLTALEGAIASGNIELTDDTSEELDGIISEMEKAGPDRPPFDRLAYDAFGTIPTFVYFSEFDDLVPFELPLKNAKDNKAFVNLARIAKLDLDAVVSADDSYARMNLLERHSATITGDLNEYWTQDKIDVVFRDRGTNLIVAFREHGNTTLFKAEQRSKGFQWFLSFYAAMQDIDFGNSIIFIDEPGTFLHAAAQRNVLAYLREISNRGAQVLYSTHSPYLIDSNELHNLRLVIKDTDVTRVEGKYYKAADKDTLTPVITAIGLDLSGALNVGKNDNLIFEGVSDAFYCSGMLSVLADAKFSSLSIIPCLGSTTVGTLLSVFGGWGYRAAVVLDSDAAGKREGGRIEKAYLKDKAPIVYVSTTAGESIEDLFSRHDFDNVVLEGFDVTVRTEPLNSKYVRAASLDKVLIARRFAQRASRGEITVSDDTRSRFNDLFERCLNRLRDLEEAVADRTA